MDRRQALLAIAATCMGCLAKPALGIAEPTPYSWYGGSLHLVSKAVTTPLRYFDGSNIGIEMTCSADRHGSFEVTCCDASGACLGTRVFPYQGFLKRTWRMPRPGNYRFVFRKMYPDLVPVTSSDVKMYSW